MRYRIDDLGWYQFERLVQSLLKAELGLAVESWGGHSDLGRDAYSRKRLRIQAGCPPEEGPFLFQVKFIQAANASGARSSVQLLGAVRGEMEAVKKRRSRLIWKKPRHYVLITNAPLTAGIRSQVSSLVEDELECEFLAWGGHDVCDMLDNHPKLRRSFPEILSLRDLDGLLSEVVHRDIIERSRAAIDETRDLVPVFVPTKAYNRAWKIIEEHSIVVLDGPPEMGKTAIARTIALGHLLQGWQAVECRGPDDFFSMYEDESKQVFVADDAFGRTEFDPTLARVWERDLPRIYHRIDNTHRLLLTTRKHILQRALRDLDLTGKARHFPKPSEILVTASDLTVEEKSRILYRHAKGLGLPGREIVRKCALEVVNNEHFTPERIRKIVVEVIPELAAKSGAQQSDDLSGLLLSEIRNATGRMQRAFNKLAAEHQWLLVVMLDLNKLPSIDDLATIFTESNVNQGSAFDAVFDDLNGTFLRVVQLPYRAGKCVDWIHPSYRDLVISELARRPPLNHRFLAKARRQGLRLAISEQGGLKGETAFPLLTDRAAALLWSERATELAAKGRRETFEICVALAESLENEANVPAQAAPILQQTLRMLSEDLIELWTESGLNPIEVHTYLGALSRTGLSFPRPDVSVKWEEDIERLKNILSSGIMPDPAELDDWTRLRDLIDEHYLSLGESPAYRRECAIVEELVFELAENELESFAPSDGNEIQQEGERLRSLAETLSLMDPEGARLDLIEAVDQRAEEYLGYFDEPDSDPDYEPTRPTSEPFNLELFFSDL